MPGIFKIQYTGFRVCCDIRNHNSESCQSPQKAGCAVLHTVICGAYTYLMKITNSYIQEVILSSHDSEAEKYGAGVENNQRYFKVSCVLEGLVSWELEEEHGVSQLHI